MAAMTALTLYFGHVWKQLISRNAPPILRHVRSRLCRNVDRRPSSQGESAPMKKQSGSPRLRW
jgi:hypothetical protein